MMQPPVTQASPTRTSTAPVICDFLRPFACSRVGRAQIASSRRFAWIAGLVVAMLAISSLAVPPRAAEGKGIRFWNLTSSTIKKLYLSPAGKDAFGADQCANDPDGTVD